MQKGLIFSVDELLIFGDGTSNLSYSYQDGGGIGSAMAISLSGHSDRDGFVNDCFRFYLTSEIGHPEPLDGYQSKVILHIHGFFMDNITIQLESEFNPTLYGITDWSLRVYLKEPKVYTFIEDGKLHVMLEVKGKRVSFTSNISDLDTLIDDDEYYQITRMYSASTAIPLLGEVLYHSNFVNYSLKGIINGTINFNNDCNFGYRYRINDTWHDLPVKSIYEKPYNSSIYPIFTATNTADAYSKVAGLASQQYSETSYFECMLYPNIKSNIYRNKKDNNTLVLRSSIPRVLQSIWRQTPSTGDTIEYTKRDQILKKEGFLLTVLEDESDSHLDEGIERFLENDFYIPYYANFTFGGSVIGAHQYNSLIEIEDHLQVGADYYDPTNQIFAQLYSPITGIKPYCIDIFPLYLNPRTLFAFMLFYPVDSDTNHWKLGEPLRKANSEDYWMKVRTQYIQHSQLPEGLRKKRRNYIVDTGLNTSLSEALDRTAQQKYSENFGVSLYYSGLPFTYIGLNNPVIDEWDYGVNERKSDVNDRYVITNGSITSSDSDKITITPTGTEVEVEYELGSFTDYPYLYDLFANKIKYELSGSNIDNIKVYKVSVNEERLIYDGTDLSKTLSKTLLEDDNYAGTWSQDFTAEYEDPIAGTFIEFDNGRDITVDNLTGISATVMTGVKSNIDFQLTLTNEYHKIKFVITLDDTNPFEFYYLRFSSDYGAIYDLIETPNQHCIFNSNRFIRFGMLKYENEDGDEINEVPTVNKPHQRVSAIDYQSFKRNYIESKIVDEEEIKDDLEIYFDKDELFPYEIVDNEKVYDESVEHITGYLSTAIPIVNKSNYSKNAITFALVNYLRELPAVPTLFIKHFNQNFISTLSHNRSCVLINPYKKYYSNVGDNIFLYNEGNLSNSTTDYSSIHNITEADFRYENNEVMRDWSNNPIEDYFIRYPMINNGNIANITPFWGYFSNVIPEIEEPGNTMKIYQLDYPQYSNELHFLAKKNEQYYYGKYYPRENDFEIEETEDRSIYLDFLGNVSYLIRTDDEYTQITNGEPFDMVDLDGYHPFFIKTSKDCFLSSAGTTHNLFIANVSGKFIESVELLETFPLDEGFNQLTMAEYDIYRKLLVLAYYKSNDSIIKIFNKDGLTDYAFSFKEEFGEDKIFKYPYCHLDIKKDVVWINSWCDDNKIYFIGIRNGFRLEKFSVEVQDLIEFYHPFIFRDYPLLCCNTIKGIKLYGLDKMVEGSQAVEIGSMTGL